MDGEERLAREALSRGWISQELLGHALRHRAKLRQQGQDVPLLALLQQAAPPFAQPLGQLAAQLGHAPAQTHTAGPPPPAPRAPLAPIPGSTTRPAPPQQPVASYPPPQGPTHAAGFAPPQAPQSATESTFAIVDPPALAAPAGGAFSPASLGKLGPYELIREIARGGVGAVFEAVQPAVNRKVAVKVLLDSCSDPEQAERFKREGQAVTRLSHENIVTVHDFGYEGKQSYLVMELVLGDTLKQRVQGGALPQRVAVRYTLKLARAMAYAHSKGVIHRDLKPQNVILDPRDEPRITDFGLARITDLESLTKTGAVMGTPAYMAPEQVRGDKAQIDHRADVYALGVILYELLTGKPPFRKKTVVAVMDQVLRQDPAPSSLQAGIDPAIDALCLACMIKDPDQRLSSALELAEELDDLSRAWDQDEDDPDTGSGSSVQLSLVLAALLALAGVVAAAWVLLTAQR